MSWKNPLKTFLKENQQSKFSTFSIPITFNTDLTVSKEGLNAIFHTEQSGGTALLLHITEFFTQKEIPVYYFTLKDNIYPHRLLGINTEYLDIVKPLSTDIVFEIASKLDNEEAVFIFDCIHEQREKWDLKNNIRKFLLEIKQANPNVILIADKVVRTLPKNTNGFTCSYGLTYNKAIWEHGDRIANIADLRSFEDGSISEIRIEHHTGRISRGWVLALQQINAGTSPGGNFEFQNEKIRGINNFITYVDKITSEKHIYELQNS